MRTSLARFISIVGHPFVSLSLLVLLLHSHGGPQSAIRVTFAFMTIVVLPLGLLTYFHFVEHSPAFVRGCVVIGSMMLVAFALNRWIKLSLHVAFAAFCGFLLVSIRFSEGLAILLFVPPLIWSRLVLSRHIFSETIVGLILGGVGASCLIWP